MLVGAALGAAFVVLAACGGDDPAAAGGTCSLASDCQLGLICVTLSGKGTCTSDLSKVAGQSPPDAAGVESDATADGETTSDATTPPPVKDSGTVDSAKPDTGVADTGAD